jgi:serine/threonine protein kinase/tetratricopeptide (TPR) repeat protein
MENTGVDTRGNTRWNRIQTLFHHAAELPEADRPAFLDSECGSDTEAMAEVLAMLRVDSDGDPFLDAGLPGIASRIVAAENPVREIGPYRLLQFLGEGGMGVVWRAERMDTGAIVAIKLLLGAGFSTARRERFTREIKTLAKLKHAYIARLYDAGATEDGTPWFAMEYVDGERLVDFCQQQRLPVEDRLRLFRKVCEAVQYAHSREVIHRDLKPSNILVEKDGTPRLLDFGVAKELQVSDNPSDQTRAGLRFYSPHYAAPEWVREGIVGFSTDVYSLGVILYELLTGELPIGGAENAGQKDRDLPVSSEKPSVAARNNTSLGKAPPRKAWPDLDLLCLMAMHPDPAERYRSVEALLRDLDHYLKNEPLEARPPSFSYRAGKFLVRNRRPMIAGSLIFALVVGLVAFFTVRLAKARDAAVAEAARTQRIQDFMIELLGGSDTNAAPSADLRVVTLLDEGAKEAHSLDADPATQAELYKTLARMDNMLGEYPKASGLMALAVEKEVEAHGPRDIAVADVLVMQGITFADSNDFVRAEETARRGLALTKQLRPANDPKVYIAEAYLGIVLCDEGHYQEAIAVLTPLSAWSPSTDVAKQSKAEALTNLGIANYSLGNYSAAEVFDRQALDVDKGVYGPSHPRVAEALVNIGQSLTARRRYADAEGDYRQAAAILSGWYGVQHPDTATVMSILARTLLSENKDDEAYPLLQNALEVQDRAYGGKDKQIAMTLDSLGRIEMKRGKLSAAEADFRRALEIDRSLLGDHNYQPAVMEADLADALLKENHPAQAESMARDSVALLQQVLPASDPHTGRAQIVWGHCLLALHRDTEAKVQLEAALQNLTAQPAPNTAELEQLRHDVTLASQESGATTQAPYVQTGLEKP